MHEALQALFNERKNPTHADADQIQAALLPILRLGALIDKQMAVYLEHHLNAKLTPHDPALDAKQQTIHNRFQAAKQCADAFIHAGYAVANAMRDLETLLDQDETEVLAWEKNNAAPRDADASTKSSP